jgi:hypothetical protein
LLRLFLNFRLGKTGDSFPGQDISFSPIDDHASLSVLDSAVRPVFTSDVALETVIPILADCLLSPSIIARLIAILVSQNPAALGSLVVTDGTVRRRSFSQELTARKLFELIRAIPFECPAFVAADLSRLFFCALALAPRTRQTG